jgi:DNA-binding MarR family transcriptional regulator
MGGSARSNREDVADALHSAAIRLLRRVRREDERTGVSPARLSALSVLVFAGPTRLTTLARHEQVKAPTMTRVVAALEADGLVRRRADSQDARAVLLEATPRGVRLMQQGRQRRVTRIARALEDVSREDLDLLKRAVSLIGQVSERI